MENKNKHQVQHCTYDETKIYTPRLSAQMKQNEPPCVFLDQAPVRIYERPLKSEASTAEQSNVTF